MPRLYDPNASLRALNVLSQGAQPAESGLFGFRNPARCGEGTQRTGDCAALGSVNGKPVVVSGENCVSTCRGGGLCL